MKASIGALVLFAPLVLAGSVALTGTVLHLLAACKPGGHPDFEISGLDYGPSTEEPGNPCQTTGPVPVQNPPVPGTFFPFCRLSNARRLCKIYLTLTIV